MGFDGKEIGLRESSFKGYKYIKQKILNYQPYLVSKYFIWKSSQ